MVKCRKYKVILTQNTPVLGTNISDVPESSEGQMGPQKSSLSQKKRILKYIVTIEVFIIHDLYLRYSGAG